MSPVDAAVAALAPISLEEVNASAQLMDRIDRKYFVPRETLAGIIAEQADEWRVLEIGGLRNFKYHTVYFDTPDLLFFRQHRQGKRRRYKVRTRTYCDTGGCFLEVKSKGYRGMTMKERLQHDADRPFQLDGEGAQFASRITGEDASRLVPAAQTVYHRTTLVGDGLRVTMDSDLECIGEEELYPGPSHVLVETKSPGRSSLMDAALLEAGVRPHRVSKYCVAAALLHPEEPHNPWTRDLRRYFGQPR